MSALCSESRQVTRSLARHRRYANQLSRDIRHGANGQQRTASFNPYNTIRDIPKHLFIEESYMAVSIRARYPFLRKFIGVDRTRCICREPCSRPGFQRRQRDQLAFGGKQHFDHFRWYAEYCRLGRIWLGPADQQQRQLQRQLHIVFAGQLRRGRVAIRRLVARGCRSIQRLGKCRDRTGVLHHQRLQQRQYRRQHHRFTDERGYVDVADEYPDLAFRSKQRGNLFEQQNQRHAPAEYQLRRHSLRSAGHHAGYLAIV